MNSKHSNLGQIQQEFHEIGLKLYGESRYFATRPPVAKTRRINRRRNKLASQSRKGNR